MFGRDDQVSTEILVDRLARCEHAFWLEGTRIRISLVCFGTSGYEQMDACRGRGNFAIHRTQWSSDYS